MKRFSFSRQPVVWVHVFALAMTLGSAYGFHLSMEKAVGIVALGEALAAAVGWTQVTPVAHPNLPEQPIDLVQVFQDGMAQFAQAQADWQKMLDAVAQARVITPLPPVPPKAPDPTPVPIAAPMTTGATPGATEGPGLTPPNPGV